MKDSKTKIAASFSESHSEVQCRFQLFFWLCPTSMVLNNVNSRLMDDLIINEANDFKYRYLYP
uniref:Uncharacterized protein n=1 Tax=Tetranychus urticae TaxID=32264 RepID=T1K1A5_TETUR